ncbi:MAG: DNA-binding protein [Ruminococcaceae bacterium]|nr:DNA-binding protein [Oscillospiraceae bacterium]
MAKDLKLAPLIELYAGVLTEKQREVIELYYFEDLSLAEIAEHSNISRQGVRDAIKRGETIILELEGQLHFYKKSSQLSSALGEMRTEANDIEIMSQRGDAPERIEKSAERIIEIIDSIE